MLMVCRWFEKGFVAKVKGGVETQPVTPEEEREGARGESPHKHQENIE